MQEKLHQPLTGEQAELFTQLQHTHAMEINAWPSNTSASDNIFSPHIEEPVMQEFVPPTLK